VAGEEVRRAAANAGGHAVEFRGGVRDQVFHPLPDSLFSIHLRLKKAFDPGGILNPGRMYRGL
jgi:glycolate oxidase FAD binding subunit